MGPLTYGMSCIKHAENRSYATEVVFFRAGLYRISSRKKANEHKHTHTHVLARLTRIHHPPVDLEHPLFDIPIYPSRWAEILKTT